jgi:hypothetical protein
MSKSNHPIDKLFREALAEQTMAPSEGARKAFLEEALKSPASGTSRKKTLFWLGGTGLFLLLGLIPWIYFSHETPSVEKSRHETSASADQLTGTPTTTSVTPKIQESESETYQSSTNPQQKNNGSITPSTADFADFAVHTERKPDIKENLPPLESLTQTPQTNNSAVAIPSVDPPSGVTDTSPVTSIQNNQETSAVAPITENVIQKFQDTVVPAPSLIDTSTSEPVSHSETQNRSTGPKSGLPLSIGLSYSPEWMFNTLEGSKFINNFALEGIFHYGPFSIRTGAGISIGKGTNEVTISYNDYLGTYNHLDSMRFIWNNPAHNFVPTMYISKKDVWDSLIKLDQAKIVKRFTYLQVPLIFGFEFYERESFSIGGRLGPVMSVLLNAKQLSSPYDPGKNRVISINDISPGQINLNWQLMAGIAGSIRLNEKLRIEVEPEVRYYFNSVYEKPYDNPKPWSAGVRAGLILDLK